MAEIITVLSLYSELLEMSEFTPEANFLLQRLVTFLHAFLEVSRPLNQLPYLCTVIQKIYDRVSNCWPEVEMLPYFPAFS